MKIKKFVKIKLTPEQFTEKYYTDYLFDKYGDEWTDTVIEYLFKEKNIEIEFVYS
jgi:hypothetical protein